MIQFLKVVACSFIHKKDLIHLSINYSGEFVVLIRVNLSLNLINVTI